MNGFQNVEVYILLTNCRPHFIKSIFKIMAFPVGDHSFYRQNDVNIWAISMNFGLVCSKVWCLAMCLFWMWTSITRPSQSGTIACWTCSQTWNKTWDWTESIPSDHLIEMWLQHWKDIWLVWKSSIMDLVAQAESINSSSWVTIQQMNVSQLKMESKRPFCNISKNQIAAFNSHSCRASNWATQLNPSPFHWNFAVFPTHR